MMFYRTSEFDAGFGVQPDEIPGQKQAEGPDHRKSAWRRAVDAVVDSGTRAIRRRPARRPQRLTLDGLSNHMLRDLGLTRADLGALGGMDASRPWSRTDWRR